MRVLLARWRGAAEAPVDGASLGVARALLGLVLLGGVLRMVARGWVGAIYVAPAVHLPFPFAPFVQAWGPWGMSAHVGVLGAASAALMLGWRTRVSAAVLLVAFVWLKLVDACWYLNHEYLCALLTALCVVLPVGASCSADAAFGRGAASVPAWTVWLMRFQVGVVYAFAGLAKLGEDWLIYGEPLTTWLAARAEVPVLGPIVAAPGVGRWMAWAGTAFDLLIVPALLSRWRVAAWFVLVAFHVVTGLLFPIGTFPFVMVAVSTVFFDPAWPRRWVRWVGSGEGWRAPLTGWRAGAVAGWVAWQLVTPLRSHAMTSDVLWTEQGFRWSWRVLIVEKTGTLRYRVVDRATGIGWVDDPADWLTPWQLHMVSTQPDLVLQVAHRIAARERRAGREVAVYADNEVRFNGRPSTTLVRSDLDLVQVQDGWGERWWVAPRPAGPPLRGGAG